MRVTTPAVSASIVVASAAVGSSDDEHEITENLALIETLAKKHGLPVIALVSSSDQELLGRFADAGASYCLSKPPHRRHLRASVPLIAPPSPSSQR